MKDVRTPSVALHRTGPWHLSAKAKLTFILLLNDGGRLTVHYRETCVKVQLRTKGGAKLSHPVFTTVPFYPDTVLSRVVCLLQSNTQVLETHTRVWSELCAYSSLYPPHWTPRNRRTRHRRTRAALLYWVYLLEYFFVLRFRSGCHGFLCLTRRSIDRYICRCHRKVWMTSSPTMCWKTSKSNAYITSIYSRVL